MLTSIHGIHVLSFPFISKPVLRFWLKLPLLPLLVISLTRIIFHQLVPPLQVKFDSIPHRIVPVITVTRSQVHCSLLRNRLEHRTVDPDVRLARYTATRDSSRPVQRGRVSVEGGLGGKNAAGTYYPALPARVETTVRLRWGTRPTSVNLVIWNAGLGYPGVVRTQADRDVEKLGRGAGLGDSGHGCRRSWSLDDKVDALPCRAETRPGVSEDSI